MQKEKKQLYKVVDPNKDIKFERAIKDPEDKLYLVCIKNTTDDYNAWEILNGRSNAREFIILNIDDIDFETSFVLVEGLDLNQRVSIYAFMKHIERFYEDEPFDIDDYIKGDWSESDFMEKNQIDPMYINKSDSLSMEDLMGSNINRVSLE